MRLIVDVMGGDHGPRPVVEGAVRASRRHGVSVILVGRQPEIEAELAGLDTAGLSVDIVHAEQVVGMDEKSPATAVRKSPDSSVSKGMSMLRHGDGDAYITIGPTGAAVAGAMFRLGRSHGVRRPALAAPFPTTNGPCVLIDIGASADARPRFLLHFAIMGAAYSERVLGIDRPRVGLVSIGEERGKGSQLVRETFSFLEASGLNFIGNVEGRDIPVGNVDVAVMDGFTGNVVIKFAEGVAALVEDILRDAVSGDPLATVGGLMMRPALRRARERMDHRSYGGAVLLGVRGMVVIGHGRSDAEAVMAAAGVAIRGVEHDLVGAIERRIAQSGVAPTPAAAEDES